MCHATTAPACAVANVAYSIHSRFEYRYEQASARRRCRLSHSRRPIDRSRVNPCAACGAGRLRRLRSRSAVERNRQHCSHCHRRTVPATLPSAPATAAFATASTGTRVMPGGPVGYELVLWVLHKYGGHGGRRRAPCAYKSPVKIKQLQCPKSSSCQTPRWGPSRYSTSAIAPCIWVSVPGSGRRGGEGDQGRWWD